MTTAPDARHRAAAVDGLRALAALSVLGYHAWLYTRERVDAGLRTSAGDYVAHELRLGLVLFFVLSGFLLYAPWVRAALAGRSARRGSAPICCAAPAASCPPTGWRSPARWRWSGACEGTPGVRLPPAEDLWLFAVFGQNFTTPTLLRLNAPLWTLAVEASFYVVLPALGLARAAAARRGREAQALVPTAPAAGRRGLELDDRGPGRPADADEGPAGHGAVLRGRHARRAAGPRARAAAARRPGAAGRGRGARGRRRRVGRRRGPRRLPGPHAARPARPRGRLRVRRACCSPSTCAPAPRLLRSRPLALVGLWSYGVYLWHVPLLLWLRGHGLLPADGWGALAVVTPPTLLVAAASWRFLERPAQDWARRVAARRAARGRWAAGTGDRRTLSRRSGRCRAVVVAAGGGRAVLRVVAGEHVARALAPGADDRRRRAAQARDDPARPAARRAAGRLAPGSVRRCRPWAG